MKHIVLALMAMLILVTSITPARGGNEDAGGGDVVWRLDHADRPVLLDFYVGVKLGFLNGPEDLALGLGDPKGEPERVKVRRILGRVARFDPELARRAREILTSYDAVIEHVSGPIESIEDENLETELEPGKGLFQAAVWKAREGSMVERWLVNDLIWQKMDRNQRAGLILHEIFYVLHNERRVKNDRQQNARYLRQFIAVISGWSFTGAPADEWAMMMAAFNLF